MGIHWVRFRGYLDVVQMTPLLSTYTTVVFYPRQRDSEELYRFGADGNLRLYISYRLPPRPNDFCKKSVARWAERSPGKRGIARWIGDEETASGRFDSEAENKKLFLNFFVTFFFQEKKV